MPWWTCFSCANTGSQPNSSNGVVELDYSHHSLQTVPSDVFQFEKTLEVLHLSANRITELPRQLFLCHQLKSLMINDNELSSIPPAISSLINLQKLNFARNSLTRLTDSIAACKSLTYLDLSVNNLEKLPDAIITLTRLEELYLNDTFLEYLPSNIGRLNNLKILELRDNNLITLPSSMSRLTQLKRLDIGNNEFTELPEVIGHLVGLCELWCDGNRIRRINCNLSTLRELIHFDASNNLLQHLPTEIGNWLNCQEMCLSTNELEALPFSIGMMKSLVALKVDENQLQELPDSISELHNLEELMVSHNDLFKLPSTIGFLRRLRFLTADENLLRTLPGELCNCLALTVLSVRGNKLTKVPPDIGRLTELRVINIVNNFVSHLPVSVLNLQQLTALWMSDNQSQPLMPLHKEFNEEGQYYYLTGLLLPQAMTASSDYAGGKGSQRSHAYADHSESFYGTTPNAHIAALENLSLDALVNHAQNVTVANKRRICFASEPVQEMPAIDHTSRLMRSPTPYPKELRMMSKFAAKNMGQHGNLNAHHHPDHPAAKNLSTNFDEVDNYDGNVSQKDIEMSELRNRYASGEAAKQVYTDPAPNRSETDDDNYGIDYVDPAVRLNVATFNNQPIKYESFNESNRKTKAALEGHSLYEKRPKDAESSFTARERSPSEQSNQHFTPSHPDQQNQINTFADTASSISNNKCIYYTKTYQSSQVSSPSSDSESNRDGSTSDQYDPNSKLLHSNSVNQLSQQQQPPPYHIAKAFTKKTKQDLLIYDIYRNNYQKQQHQPLDGSHQNTNEQQLLLSASPAEAVTASSAFHYGDHLNANEMSDINLNVSSHSDTQSRGSATHSTQNGNNNISNTSSSWLFGSHKNPTVIQLNIPKLSSEIGFKIIRHSHQGIFISEVSDQSPAFSLLRPMDKVLDVDGNDFTKFSLRDAETVLSNSGPVMSIMVSRGN